MLDIRPVPSSHTDDGWYPHTNSRVIGTGPRSLWGDVSCEVQTWRPWVQVSVRATGCVDCLGKDQLSPCEMASCVTEYGVTGQLTPVVRSSCVLYKNVSVCVCACMLCVCGVCICECVCACVHVCVHVCMHTCMCTLYHAWMHNRCGGVICSLHFKTEQWTLAVFPAQPKITYRCSLHNVH